MSLRKIIIIFISFLIKVFDKIIPKNNKLIVFGAIRGNFYGDNSRHLFEWILSNRQDLVVTWVAHSPEVFRELKELGLPVVYPSSLKGFLLLLRAKVALFTNSLKDFALDDIMVPSSIKLIALRHGRSVKRIRFARKEHKITFAEEKKRRYEGRLIKYAISTSHFISQMQEECLQIGKDKHIVTGYPRNDCLIKPSIDLENKWKSFIKEDKYKKVILYAPSWRHGRVATKFFPFADFDKDKLVSFLDKNNFLLLLRPHVNDLLQYHSLRQFINELSSKSDMIKIASHYEYSDVNYLLPFVDLLISDYSAIYHDFLLLDRPMMFIPYDYEDFELQNGFLYDYYSCLPGALVKSFADFCNCLGKIAKGEDLEPDKRRNLCDKVHFYKDAKSCNRVMGLIDNLLSEK